MSLIEPGTSNLDQIRAAFERRMSALQARARLINHPIYSLSEYSKANRIEIGGQLFADSMPPIEVINVARMEVGLKPLPVSAPKVVEVSSNQEQRTFSSQYIGFAEATFSVFPDVVQKKLKYSPREFAKEVIRHVGFSGKLDSSIEQSPARSFSAFLGTKHNFKREIKENDEYKKFYNRSLGSSLGAAFRYHKEDMFEKYVDDNGRIKASIKDSEFAYMRRLAGKKLSKQRIEELKEYRSRKASLILNQDIFEQAA